MASTRIEPGRPCATLDRWSLLERIYHEAVERPVAERRAFLDSACAGDEALRQELESLLAKDGLSLLDKSALDVAACDLVSDRAPSWVGRTIRGYEILALLGAGGMGDVYRARDRSLGRDVAIKVLPDEVSRDPERLRRLEREARILAALNHPNIATLHGLEKHEDHPFLVMELVPGQTLAERLRHGALRFAKRSTSAARSPKGSKRRTTRASSIGTSNRQTSRSRPTSV